MSDDLCKGVPDDVFAQDFDSLELVHRGLEESTKKHWTQTLYYHKGSNKEIERVLFKCAFRRCMVSVWVRPPTKTRGWHLTSFRNIGRDDKFVYHTKECSESGPSLPLDIQPRKRKGRHTVTPPQVSAQNLQHQAFIHHPPKSAMEPKDSLTHFVIENLHKPQFRTRLEALAEEYGWGSHGCPAPVLAAVSHNIESRHIKPHHHIIPQQMPGPQQVPAPQPVPQPVHGPVQTIPTPQVSSSMQGIGTVAMVGPSQCIQESEVTLQ
eukprot:gnl/Dysnectes_brevis/2085_a2418_1711.p1 GENE.gnl/Dysnectes_brevis/2085_a2418_1711~~gnl/Dysnectes_brevis/2085_a2418_1711.p1  ORF type:complete len:265 (-),score=75.05 gnl/Dysnectes_brevis/2085_a2418_1711:22-816(-)